MSTALIWRLVWKDARTLLPVWLAVLSLAVGMQVVCAIGAAVDNQWNADFGTMLVAVAIGLFPLPIAAGAISFASETEEGTGEWLRQLPISAWWLAGIKLLTPLMICVLYVVAATLTGAAASRLKQFEYPTSEAVISWSSFLFTVYATSAFFSLQRKKVVSAAALGMLCGALLHILVFIWWIGPDDMRFARVGWPIAGLLAIDYALAVRWARGRSIWPAIRNRLPSTSFPEPDIWTPALSWSVAQRDPAVRATLALAWKELRGIAWLVSMWSLVGCVVVQWPGMRSWDLIGVSVAYMLLTAMLAGLFAYMGDQSKDLQLFFGERGLSPALVWITRNALWFSAAIVLVIGWSLWDRYALHPNEWPREEDQYFHRSVLGILDEVRVNEPAARPYPPPTAEDSWLQFSLAGSLLLGFFALGGVCGMWFRRPVVATAAAVVGGSLLYGWHWLALKAAVPLWLTTWPLAIVWLFATWRGCDRWLTARTNWGRQSAWMFLPCVFVVTMFSIARRYQIPEVDLSLDEVEARWMAFDDEQSHEWQELSDHLVDKFPIFSIEPLPEEEAVELAEHIHRVATTEPYGRWSLMPEQRLVSNPLLRITAGFAERRGLELREQGRFREELDLYVDTLLLMDRVAPLQSDVLRSRRLLQLYLLSFIKSWANHPEQTDEHLRYGLERLYTGSQSWYELGRRGHRTDSLDARDVQTMAENHAALSRQMIRREGVMFDLMSQGVSLFGKQPTRDDFLYRTRVPALLRGIYYLTGEYTRYERLLAAMAVDARSHNSFDRAQFDRWVAATPEFSNDDEFYRRIDVRLRYREPLSSEFEEADTEHEERELDARLQDDGREVVAAFRFAVLTIALQIHRREFGEYPEHLTDLQSIEPRQLRMVMVDPFTETNSWEASDDLQWYPKGLPGPVIVGDSSSSNDRSVAAHQPLLVSRGRLDRSLHFVNYAASGVADVEPSRGAYLDGSKRSYDTLQLNLSIRHEPPLIANILTWEDGPPDVVASLIVGPANWGKYRQQGWRTAEDDTRGEE